jgi:hypothetical protein
MYLPLSGIWNMCYAVRMFKNTFIRSHRDEDEGGSKVHPVPFLTYQKKA